MKQLTTEEIQSLLDVLRKRFDEHMERHEGIKWEDVEAKLKAHDEKLWSLMQMERTDGEPDVIGYDSDTNEYIYCDCAKESPKGRRSLCFDDVALEARKKHKPSGSAMALANEMGIEMLSEEEYRALQQLGEFDLKTSSWIQTPEKIRKLGGALFCDRRYDTVFVYHNGADSYYASRGFRGILRV